MAKIYLEGLDDLHKKLKKNVQLADVKRVVRQNGAELNAKVVRNANFKKGYQTGTTKRSVTLTHEDSGFTSIVQPTTGYSELLEVGTRFMEAQPFVGPAFNVQKETYEKDMKKLFK